MAGVLCGQKFCGQRRRDREILGKRYAFELSEEEIVNAPRPSSSIFATFQQRQGESRVACNFHRHMMPNTYLSATEISLYCPTFSSVMLLATSPSNDYSYLWAYVAYYLNPQALRLLSPFPSA